MNGINPISGDHGLINTDNGLIPLITLLNGCWVLAMWILIQLLWMKSNISQT
jgi:hypothetical protein